MGLVVSVRAKFIHNLRISRLPSEFNDFVKRIDVADENVRNLRFSNFNYCLDPDKTNQKYSITKSWNNLPFDLKSTEPDYFLGELRKYFNYSNKSKSKSSFQKNDKKTEEKKKKRKKNE